MVSIIGDAVGIIIHHNVLLVIHFILHGMKVQLVMTSVVILVVSHLDVQIQMPVTTIQMRLMMTVHASIMIVLANVVVMVQIVMVMAFPMIVRKHIHMDIMLDI